MATGRFPTAPLEYNRQEYGTPREMLARLVDYTAGVEPVEYDVEILRKHVILDPGLAARLYAWVVALMARDPYIAPGCGRPPLRDDIAALRDAIHEARQAEAG